MNCICASRECKECVFGVCPKHGFTIIPKKLEGNG